MQSSIVPYPAANQRTTAFLVFDSIKVVLTVFGVGFALWLLLRSSMEGHHLLLLLIANQAGCVLVAFRLLHSQQKISPSIRALAASVLVMVVAVLLGVCYDVVLRLLFGNRTPTIGPWGEVRRMAPLPACLTIAFAVLIGSAGDEWLYRARLFGAWQAANRPGLGAVVSSGLFALSRLDAWNLPAYFGLGLLLCATYRRTGSVVVSWMAHALLNAAMFVMLFCGYE